MALRDSIAGCNPFSLEEALRWAKTVGGVDRDLLKMGRRRLPPLRMCFKLKEAMNDGDADLLEEVIAQSSWVGVEEETLSVARARLAALQLDWLPVRTLTAADLENAAAPASHRECIICLETYREHDCQAFLPCCHRFHAACVKSWLAKRTRCPVCSCGVVQEGAQDAEASCPVSADNDLEQEEGCITALDVDGISSANPLSPSEDPGIHKETIDAEAVGTENCGSPSVVPIENGNEPYSSYHDMLSADALACPMDEVQPASEVAISVEFPDMASEDKRCQSEAESNCSHMTDHPSCAGESSDRSRNTLVFSASTGNDAASTSLMMPEVFVCKEPNFKSEIDDQVEEDEVLPSACKLVINENIVVETCHYFVASDQPMVAAEVDTFEAMAQAADLDCNEHKEAVLSVKAMAGQSANRSFQGTP